jgi:hypothetical protein
MEDLEDYKRLKGARSMTRFTERTLVLMMTLAVAGALVIAQADPFAGTWTLNVARSKYDPGPGPKSGSATFATTGKTVKVVVDGVNAAGNKTHFEYSAAADGKDHPLSGNADGDTMSLRQISPSSVETTFKMKGKITVINVRTVSADGKTMTVTTKGTNAAGQKVNNLQVYEKK